jgi:uncharacterized cupredoxin-like copper-binding protein
MRVTSRRFGAVVVAVLAMVALAEPTAGSAARTSGTHALQVQIGEWNVIPSQGLVAAGPVHLTVENFGRLLHELDIIPTARWGEKLPILTGRALSHDAAAPVVVHPGQTRSVQVTLAPGFYILLDNIRGHYALGTEVPIVVS